MAIEPPKRARVSLPSWLWNGNPKALLAECEMFTRPAGGGRFFVQPNESYFQQRLDLVRLHRIANPMEGAPRWAELSKFTERVSMPLPERLHADLQRRLRRAEERGAFVDLLNHQVLLLHSVPVADLPSQAKQFVETLNAFRFSEDRQGRPFGNTSVHLVETSTALLHRLNLASVWVRMEQDPRLGGGDPSHLYQLGREDGGIFSSSRGLYDGVLMFDAYLGPLLAAGTPAIWGVNITRSFGLLVFGLGTFVSGTEGEASELLQLVTTPGAKKATEFPRLSPLAAEGALTWWTERLNLLFGVLSDLSTFADSQGDYRPAKHLESLLTIEQIFRRTTSMLVADRDTNARRTLLFTILDSLVGVRGVNLLKMCTLSHASTVLASLEASLPAPAAEILLPAARRAVSALREMQDGFFIRRQLATGTVDLQIGGTTTRSLSVEDATARYLKVLRDATHGHGADKESAKALTAGLLAHHDGAIPHDVGLLGYLYLLDLLAHPDRLRMLLFRGGGK